MPNSQGLDISPEALDIQGPVYLRSFQRSSIATVYIAFLLVHCSSGRRMYLDGIKNIAILNHAYKTDVGNRINPEPGASDSPPPVST